MADVTEREIELVREVWTHVEKDYAHFGHVLFKEFFAAYPDYTKYFDPLKTNPDDDLFECPRFKRHIENSLLPAVSDMLTYLDQPYELLALLKNFAFNHKQRKVKSDQFEGMHKTFIVTFRKLFGDKITPEAEAAWDHILSIAYNEISEEL